MSWCLSQDLCSLYPSLSHIGTMLGASVGLLFSGTFAQLKAGPEPHRPKLLTRRALSSCIERLLQLLVPVATSAVPPSPTSTNHLQLATHQSPRAYLSGWLVSWRFISSTHPDVSTALFIKSTVMSKMHLPPVHHQPQFVCSPKGCSCLSGKCGSAIAWQSGKLLCYLIGCNHTFFNKV